jgi:hypothetical protein
MLVLGVLSSLLVALSLFLFDNPSEAVSVYKTVVPITEEATDMSRDFIADGRRVQSAVFNGDQSESLSQIAVSSEAVPLADSSDGSTSVTVWQGRGSWSLGNGVLSIIGLIEALIVMSVFFVRSWNIPRPLFTQGFILRIPVLVVALICLVVTGISSDFTQPLTVFNGASVPIAILFAAQQSMLPRMRMPKAPVVKDKGQERRFRAETRYEG